MTAAIESIFPENESTRKGEEFLWRPTVIEHPEQFENRLTCLALRVPNFVHFLRPNDWDQIKKCTATQQKQHKLVHISTAASKHWEPQ